MKFRGALQVVFRGLNERSTPKRRLLFRKWHHGAEFVEPRRTAGLGVAHERGQSQALGFLGKKFRQHSGEIQYLDGVTGLRAGTRGVRMSAGISDLKRR